VNLLEMNSITIIDELDTPRSIDVVAFFVASMTVFIRLVDAARGPPRRGGGGLAICNDLPAATAAADISFICRPVLKVFHYSPV